MRFFHVVLTGAVLATALVAQVPAVADGGVLNAASFAKGTPVSPGSLVSIFGTELAAGLAQADSVPLSTTLADVKVTFNGIPAPLQFVSQNQINAEMPWDVLPKGVSSGVADVVVTRGGKASAAMMVQIGPSMPGIFSIPPGAGYAIAINPDGSLAAPNGAIPGFPTHPAKVGDPVILLATGLGAVDVPVANGAGSSDKIRRTVITPGVFIGGQAASVGFSGLSPQFPGVNQLNVVVPSVTSGDKLPVQLEVSSVRTTDQVIMAVGQ